MPHFMYQLLWAMGYPDILKNITYGCVSVRMVPDLISLELVDWVEKAVAPHSSTLAWKIPWMEEPGVCRLWGLTVRHDWSNLAVAAIHWIKQMPLPNLTTTTQSSGSLNFLFVSDIALLMSLMVLVLKISDSDRNLYHWFYCLGPLNYEHLLPWVSCLQRADSQSL